MNLVHLYNCSTRVPPSWNDIKDSILFVRLSQYESEKLFLLNYTLCKSCSVDLIINRQMYDKLKNFI